MHTQKQNYLYVLQVLMFKLTYLAYIYYLYNEHSIMSFFVFTFTFVTVLLFFRLNSPKCWRIWLRIAFHHLCYQGRSLHSSCENALIGRSGHMMKSHTYFLTYQLARLVASRMAVLTSVLGLEEEQFFQSRRMIFPEKGSSAGQIK